MRLYFTLQNVKYYFLYISRLLSGQLIYGVAPHAGAWIETNILETYNIILVSYQVDLLYQVVKSAQKLILAIEREKQEVSQQK